MVATPSTTGTDKRTTTSTAPHQHAGKISQTGVGPSTKWNSQRNADIAKQLLRALSQKKGSDQPSKASKSGGDDSGNEKVGKYGADSREGMGTGRPVAGISGSGGNAGHDDMAGEINIDLMDIDPQTKKDFGRPATGTTNSAEVAIRDERPVRRRRANRNAVARTNRNAAARTDRSAPARAVSPSTANRAAATKLDTLADLQSFVRDNFPAAILNAFSGPLKICNPSALDPLGGGFVAELDAMP